jgi:phage baseplate assembly protein W
MPERDLLGTGWRFPPEVSPAGRFELRSGASLVRQSVLVILGTEPGERLMRPDFGCGLLRYLMEPNTPATREAMIRDIDAALRTWEPRIALDTVSVAPTADQNAVLVTVTYTLVRDQSADAVQATVPVALSARQQV